MPIIYGIFAMRKDKKLKNKCIAMLLAGGQGSRLGALTQNLAKPAVLFGGKYRIIDFPLSNCMNSDINKVGVLTQYKPLILNDYIDNGSSWALENIYGGGLSILSPYVTQTGGKWYKGTADAIFQNMEYIDRLDPKHVLILSGDHIYKMHYDKMLDFHEENHSDATISVMEVPWDDASRFGIMNTEANMKIYEFEEKPANPKSNLASMGIYIFRWSTLKKALIEDSQDPASKNDFGMNIIPKLLNENKTLFAYPFKGYWRDVGTIDSYYNANMDLLDPECEFDLNEQQFKIYSNNISLHPHYIGKTAKVSNSLICDGSVILGHVYNSILSHDVRIEKGAILKNSIVHRKCHIKAGAYVENAILTCNAVVEKNQIIKPEENENIIVY
jgi:glucose-1-phosphate adenylyltransferase